MFDLLIRNALIADGSGGEPYPGSLAVQDGRIAAIGPDVQGAARETVDASGRVLMPGIIDGHTHYDAQITWDPFADPSPANGVTTVVMGNCGFTIAPCRPEHRDLTMRNLTHVEGMSLDALRAGIRWEFESFPQYLDMLQRLGVGPNVAGFVGHSSVRTYVMGADASARAATDAEIARMAEVVRDALEAGAVGFSSTTNEPHNGEGGVPMPSRLADERELRALTRVLGESGRGVFMTTKGACTSIAELEALATANQRPTLVSGFLHNPANPARASGFLAEIAAARSRGARLWGEVTCCPLTMDFTLESAYMFEGFPAWMPAMTAHGAEELAAVYRDPAFRAAVKQDLVALRGKRAFNSEWDKLHVLEVGSPENATLEGRSIADIAAAAGKEPLDALLDLGLSEGLRTRFTATLLNSDDTEVAKLITDPDNYVTLSDAGAHLSFFCDAGFGLHLLGKWTRDLGVFTLGEAVRKLTAQPADIFGLKGRGRLRAGHWADLMLFDPATVSRGKARRVEDLPAGAARIVRPAVGVHGVWVNGQRVVDDDGAVSQQRRPGQVLRDFERSAAGTH
jgi:N-acyl-D-amino-acid deacylase